MASRKPAKEAVAKPAVRCLMNPTTGRVFAWTERLAERADLVECTADGVPLRAVATRLVRKAELDKAAAEAALRNNAAAVVEVADTFRAPANPVQSPAETPASANSDLIGDEAE